MFFCLTTSFFARPGFRNKRNISSRAERYTSKENLFQASAESLAGAHSANVTTRPRLVLSRHGVVKPEKRDSGVFLCFGLSLPFADALNSSNVCFFCLELRSATSAHFRVTKVGSCFCLRKRCDAVHRHCVRGAHAADQEAFPSCLAAVNIGFEP